MTAAEPSWTIAVDPELAARGFDARLGVIVGRLARPADGAGLEAALAALAAQPLGEPPAIAATRRAIKALGQDPARYRPSAEALRRRLARGLPLPRIAPVVDVGTLLSLETGVSIGVYDRDRLCAPIRLRAGRADERYEAVDGQPLGLRGLPVLADAAEPFGSPVRDSSRSRIRPESRAVLFVLYGFAPAPVDRALLERAAGALERLAGLAVERAELAGAS